MPSTMSNAAVPLALAIGPGRSHLPPGLLVAGVAMSVLPDADGVLFRLGATYGQL